MPQNLHSIRVIHGDREYLGSVNYHGLSLLTGVQNAQEECVTSAFHGEELTQDLPSRTRASLQRIGHLARKYPDKRKEGQPNFTPVLVAAGDWRQIEGAILILVARGKYVPVLLAAYMPTERGALRVDLGAFSASASEHYNDNAPSGRSNIIRLPDELSRGSL